MQKITCFLQSANNFNARISWPVLWMYTPNDIGLDWRWQSIISIDHRHICLFKSIKVNSISFLCGIQWQAREIRRCGPVYRLFRVGREKMSSWHLPKINIAMWFANVCVNPFKWLDSSYLPLGKHMIALISRDFHLHKDLVGIWLSNGNLVCECVAPPLQFTDKWHNNKTDSLTQHTQELYWWHFGQ